MKPQEYLSDRGKEIFEEIANHLSGKMPIDSFIISQAAHCLEMLSDSISAMNTKGYTQPTKNGYDVVNGHFSAWKEASNRFDKYCKELGLSPSSRESIKAFAESMKPKKKESKLDKLRA